MPESGSEYFENVKGTVQSFWHGLSITLSYLMRRPITTQYPDRTELPVVDTLPPRYRGFLEVDTSICTGCQACERACPVECMTVTMKDNPKQKAGESKRRKIVDTFWIDYGRCMRCNICIEVCNFDAIAMNNTWSGIENSVYDRRDFVMDMDELMAKSKAGEVAPWLGALGGGE